MIIRDVSFMRCETLDSSVMYGVVRVGTKQNNLVYVGSFWFDDCRISEATGSALFIRKGVMTFSSDASLYDLYLQFRKQDEAPEMGADSSLKLCDGCKNTFASNQEECPDCKQYANVAPIRGVKS